MLLNYAKLVASPNDIKEFQAMFFITNCAVFVWFCFCVVIVSTYFTIGIVWVEGNLKFRTWVTVLQKVISITSGIRIQSHTWLAPTLCPPPPPYSIKFAGCHLFFWIKRGSMRGKCLAQEPAWLPQPESNYHYTTVPLSFTKTFPQNGTEGVYGGTVLSKLWLKQRLSIFEKSLVNLPSQQL